MKYVIDLDAEIYFTIRFRTFGSWGGTGSVIITFSLPRVLPELSVPRKGNDDFMRPHWAMIILMRPVSVITFRQSSEARNFEPAGSCSGAM